MTSLNRLEGANHGSIGDSWPIASWGYARGRRVGYETGPGEPGTETNSQEETHPRTRASAEPRTGSGFKTLSLSELRPDAQAACAFRCSALKHSPFFQRFKVSEA